MIKLVTSEAGGVLSLNGAKDFFDHDSNWTAYNGTTRKIENFQAQMAAISWVLNALLTAKLAEELVPIFIHFSSISEVLLFDNSLNSTVARYLQNTEFQNSMKYTARKLAKVMFQMYGEVVTGHLVFRTPERVTALLVNCYPLLKRVSGFELPNSEETALKLVTVQLFSTLPLEEKVELLKLSKPNYFDALIGDYSSCPP